MIGQVPLHLIPNVAIAKIGTRHILRLFLPAKYKAGGDEYALTREQLVILYNSCVRVAVLRVNPDHQAHWPQSYENAYTQYKDLCNRIHFNTIDIPSFGIKDFGAVLLEEVRKYSWGRRAYFVHQFRGQKGATAHAPAQVNDMDREFFHGMNEAEVREHADDWYFDVGIELRKPGYVLQLSQEGHLNVLMHMFPAVPVGALERASRSNSFKEDLVAQIGGLAGFRYSTSDEIHELSGIAYCQAYTTDKSATYQLHNGIFTQFYANRLYPKGINWVIKRLRGMEEIYLRCSGERVDTAASIPSISDDDDESMKS